jgi:predicted RND superfamily exporter protein
VFSEVPKISRWLKIAGYSVTFFTVIVAIYFFFGLFGVIGLSIAAITILAIMLGMILYNNWKLFDRVTTWGAERIKGKHKEDFKLEEALKK